MDKKYFGHRIMANDGSPRPKKIEFEQLDVKEFRGYRTGDKIPKGTYTSKQLKDILEKEFTTKAEDDNKVLLQVKADPEDIGLVAGSGYYDKGTVAVAKTKLLNPKWKFVKWSDNTTNLQTSVMMNSDKTLVAYYEELDPTRLITLVGYPEEAVGSLNGAGRYNKGTTVGISATSAPYWEFKGWDDGSVENPRIVPVTKDITYTALFGRYMCNVTIAQTEGGTIAGPEGEFESGTVLTYTATPIEKYHFAGWSTGDMNPTLTYTAGEDIEISARFVKNPVNVYVEASPAGGGTITGGGMYSPDTEVTLTAIPKDSGWGFRQWSDGNTDNPRAIIVPNENITYTAEFSYLWHVITTKVEPADAGTVTGGGRHKTGEEITLTVTPTNQYCTFVKWNDGNTDNPRTFIDDGKKLTFTALMDTVKGKVDLIPTISGAFDNVTTDWQWPDTEVTLHITLKDGYKFVGYGGDVRERDITVTVPAGERITTIPVERGIPVDVSVCGEGTVYGNGIYKIGDSVTLTVVTPEGWVWHQWADYNTDNPRTFIVTSEGILTSEGLEMIANTSKLYTITTKATPDGWGTTTGDGTYPSHQPIDLTAIASEGYVLDKWTWMEYDYRTQTFVEKSSTYNPHHIGQYWNEMPTEYTAHFRLPKQYQINVTADPSVAATSLSGQGNYSEVQPVTIEAISAPGWKFTGWSRSGSSGIWTTSNPYTYTFDEYHPATVTWTANFEQIMCRVDVGLASGGKVTGGGTYPYGSQVTVEAVPDFGYVVDSWTGDILDSEGSNPFTFNITSELVTFRATFKRDGLTRVRVTASPEDVVESLSGAGTYSDGDLVNVVVTPKEGYKLSSWDRTYSSVKYEGNSAYFKVNSAETGTYDYYFNARLAPIVYGTINVQGSPTAKISSTSGSGTYETGTKVVISVVPVSGYRFVKWNDGSTFNPRQVTVGEGTATYIATVEVIPEPVYDTYRTWKIEQTPKARSLICAINGERYSTPTAPAVPNPWSISSWQTAFTKQTYSIVEYSPAGTVPTVKWYHYEGPQNPTEYNVDWVDTGARGLSYEHTIAKAPQADWNDAIKCVIEWES